MRNISYLKNVSGLLKQNKEILLVLVAGFLLRFLFPTDFPGWISPDEASKGYNAYSLIKTGKTYRGLEWPLYFNDFTKYQPGHTIIYSYLVVPSVYIFGLTLFAVRLPAALTGTITIMVIYLTTYELFTNRKAALAAAFFLAISPWHIFLMPSRYMFL